MALMVPRTMSSSSITSILGMRPENFTYALINSSNKRLYSVRLALPMYRLGRLEDAQAAQQRHGALDETLEALAQLGPVGFRSLELLAVLREGQPALLDVGGDGVEGPLEPVLDDPG